MQSLDLTSAATPECPCRARIEARLLERFKAQEPTARNHRATLLGYGVDFSTGSLSQAAQIEYDAAYTLKNGREMGKKSKGHMVFNFCPFCGVKR